jgi:hypothetical protein
LTVPTADAFPSSARRGLKIAAAVLLALVVCITAYVAAGPYLAVRGIRAAVRDNDAAALAEHVDFPALRGSLKAQLQDRLVRSAGEDMQASAFGALGLSMAGRVIDGAVDTMVTPLGIGALMQGRIIASRFEGSITTVDSESSGAAKQDAVYRYESPSRFTATLHTQSGTPVMMVLTRHGVNWRLSDLRLAP